MDNLEDQIRRMILQTESIPTRDQVYPDGYQRPVVRLPSVSNGNTHQAGGAHARLVANNIQSSIGHKPQNGQPRDPNLDSRHMTRPGAHDQHGASQSTHPRSNVQTGGPIPYQSQARQFVDPRSYNRDQQGHSRQGMNDQRGLYNPQKRDLHQHVHKQYQQRQGQYLEQIAALELPSVQMSLAERQEKEAFRLNLQQIIDRVCSSDPGHLPPVSLQCFGSFQSGFASAGSDMDLVIVSQTPHLNTDQMSLDERDLPRALEKELLRLGIGARLLTRTRVPIIKICQLPGDDLLSKLREEREKWDILPMKEKYPHMYPPDPAEEGEAHKIPAISIDQAVDDRPSQPDATRVEAEAAAVVDIDKPVTQESPIGHVDPHGGNVDGKGEAAVKKPAGKTWTRHRIAGALDFPSDGVGIQCDINFFNPLGLHNTQLLRCYSRCDPRVQPMIMFIKTWAKSRKINSSYSGTLSSYGYVLMVLHYLVNVAQPAVLPNLQGPWRPGPGYTQPSPDITEVDGWNVNFWREEHEIEDALQRGLMSQNRESIGSLLAGFFGYYASQGGPPSFHWMQDCLSLRSPGGIVSKESKGWVKAMTEEKEDKKVQHRYLFCIEDPFELTHNVARTVTHNGIVAIRDEFRRARRILYAIGNGHNQPHDGELFAAPTEAEEVVQVTRPPRHNNTKSTIAPGVAIADDVSPQARNHQNVANTNIHPNKPGATPAVTRAPNVTDAEAFPTLGGPKPGKPQQLKPEQAKAPTNDNAATKRPQFRSKQAGSKKSTTRQTGINAPGKAANAEQEGQHVAESVARAVFEHA